MVEFVEDEGDCVRAGGEKACGATFVSIRCENRLFSRSVCTRVNVGESMRSAVSSKRLRRGPMDVPDGSDVVSSLSAACPGDLKEDTVGGPITPDSTKMACSSSRGGKRYGSHFVLSRSCVVEPSIFLRTASVSSLTRIAVTTSVGETEPKTSVTASRISVRRALYPRWRRNQEKVKYRRFVSKSLPKLAHVWVAELVFEVASS